VFLKLHDVQRTLLKDDTQILFEVVIKELLLKDKLKTL